MKKRGKLKRKFMDAVKNNSKVVGCSRPRKMKKHDLLKRSLKGKSQTKKKDSMVITGT